jgi:hypothetical protein
MKKGLKALRAQIWQVIGLLRISSNTGKFKEHYARLE